MRGDVGQEIIRDFNRRQINSGNRSRDPYGNEFQYDEDNYSASEPVTVSEQFQPKWSKPSHNHEEPRRNKSNGRKEWQIQQRREMNENKYQ